MVNAICTLVMGGNDYVHGAVALAHSCRLYSTAALVCMVTSDVTDRDPLVGAYDDVVEVPYISVDAPQFIGRRANEIYSPWIGNAPTKWRCLALDTYDKVLFLDADMIVLQPIDTLFSLSVPAGTFDHHISRQYVSNPRYAGDIQEGREGIDNPYILPGNESMIHGQRIPGTTIDTLSTKRDQIAVMGGLILLEPNRMVLDLLLSEIDTIVASLPRRTISAIDELVITLFYHNHGYTWHHVGIQYNVAAYHIWDIIGKDTHILHYITPYKPWREDRSYVQANFPMHLKAYDLWYLMYRNRYIPTHPGLKDRLVDILTNVIGPRGREVVTRMFPMFQKVFVGKDVNPSANYELLEAYGDKFLAGHYVWLLLGTPGIITPHQVTRISGYFQDAIRLAEVVRYLKLEPYIRAKEKDDKVLSDVMEALIGAIGIGYERLYGRGDRAMRKFIVTIWSQVFTINAKDYRLLYENPKDRMYGLVQELHLDRNKLKESSPQIGRGRVSITVSYDSHLLATGQASLHGVYEDTAIKRARNDAYLDALRNDALQRYIDTL